jgi:hypothetical protein
MMIKISYSGYRFPPEIIQQAIWLYVRFTLSFRDVEDLLAERGIVVSYCSFEESQKPNRNNDIQRVSVSFRRRHCAFCSGTFSPTFLINAQQNGRGRAKAAPRIKQPRRADPVWFPLRVTLAQPRGEGQNVRSSSRAISLKSFSGSNAAPLSTNSCSSRIVLFGAK